MQTLPLLSAEASPFSARRAPSSAKSRLQRPVVTRLAAAAAFSLAAVSCVVFGPEAFLASKTAGTPNVRDGSLAALPDLGPGHRITLANVTKLTGSELLARPWARRIIVSERLRLIYCPIPKVGSSAWNYLIRKLEGVDDYNDLAKAHSPTTSGLRYLTDYSPKDVEALLEDRSILKFAFVRDPYQRAVSCFMDKFLNRNEAYVQREYSQFLAQLYDWQHVKSLDIYTAPRPSFAEFVDQLCKQNPMEMNEHWRPQALLCGFGEMPYDFIGHLESISQDSAHVLRHVGKHDEHFPSQDQIGFPGSGASNGGGDDFLTVETMAKLRVIYDVDFNLNRTSQ